MPDARFFETLAPLSVSALADHVGGEVVRGGEHIIDTVAPLHQAETGAVAFLGDRKFLEALRTTSAGCVIVHPGQRDDTPPDSAVILSREPQAAWARASQALHAVKTLDVAADHVIVCEDDSVVLEPCVVLGAGARIGRGSRIGAHTVVGPGVQIGRDCQIGSHVTLTCALIGDRVKILSGARIGEPGFGAAGSASGPVDIPQLGRVILQDGVTVGANTCIDRGAYDDTVIGENSKIDNLVQIGHNTIIGRNILMAAHTGISGSVTVGDNVMFGGRAGVADHLTIGEGARIAGGAGLLANVPAGETWSGYPAKPIRQFLRETVWLARESSRKRGTPPKG